MKEREKEFDRLYGAREGKKLRAGQSVEVKHARTMEETRRFLHPTIR
jgi:ribosome-associated protein YbcJ (S4-like RNA binding protein)